MVITDWPALQLQLTYAGTHLPAHKGVKIRKAIQSKIGICDLWNDYYTMSNEILKDNFNDSHWGPMEAFSLGLKLGLSLPYIPLMFIALIGNSLVCYVIHRYLQHSVTNIFLYNLSLTDILTTFAVIPISAVADIWLDRWPFGEAMCKIVPFIQCLSVTLTAFTHVLISCDRFLIVFWPLQRRRLLTPKKAKFVLLGLWLTASVQAIPNAIVGYLEKDRSLRCAESWDQEQSKAYTLTLMILQYFIPLALLICSYSVIVWKLNATQVGGVISVSRTGMAVRSKRKVSSNEFKFLLQKVKYLLTGIVN